MSRDPIAPPTKNGRSVRLALARAVRRGTSASVTAKVRSCANVKSA